MAALNVQQANLKVLQGKIFVFLAQKVHSLAQELHHVPTVQLQPGAP